jgi:hypothetical protein
MYRIKSIFKGRNAAFKISDRQFDDFICEVKLKIKVKKFLLKSRTGRKGSKKFRLQGFMTVGT